MKVLKKVVLLLSSVVFFVLLAPKSYFALALFGLFGICVGIQIGSFDLKSKKLHPVVLIILIPAACYIAYKAGRSFYAAWPPFGFLSYFASDPDSFLSLLCHCGTAASIPAVYVLLCEIVSYFGKIIPIIRKEYSIKPLLSNRSAFAKSAGIVILNLIAAIALGVVLLMGAYSLPVEKIDENVRKSAEILNSEGEYPQIYSWCTSTLDNQDDSIMLAEAADDSEGSTLERALMIYRGRIKGKGTFASFISHYLAGEEYTHKISYSRYWHGYHLFLNPLLEIMDYGGIRILNAIVQVSLTVLISFLLAKRNAEHFILPYVCTYLMLNPLILGRSMQNSSCFYAFSLGCLALLLLPAEKRSRYAFLVFLNIGIFTAYFDFLTYPMATFGIPAVLFIALQSGDSLEKKLNNLIRCGITWCVGYIVMWTSKWILTYLLTGYNTIEEAAGQFSLHTANTLYTGKAVSTAGIISMNYKAFLFNPAMIICALLIVFLIQKIKASKLVDSNKLLSTAVPYTLLSFAPAVWYAFATQHSSFVHMTNKAASVTLMAILCCLTDLRSRAVNSKQQRRPIIEVSLQFRAR